MSFLKRLFSSKTSGSASPKTSETTKITNDPETPTEPLSGIISDAHFDERYTEQNTENDSQVFDGCVKMVESYFLDNKLERRITSPVNHPANLDQTMDDGFGFKLYCQAFQLGESDAVFFLAASFALFMVKEMDFKLYADNQPEYPLRGMTLKYNKNGVLLSLYPFEYASKVLNYEGSFEELYGKVKAHLSNLPSQEELLNR